MLNHTNMKKSITILLFTFCFMSLSFAQNILTKADKTNYVTATISDPKGSIPFKAAEVLCRNKNVGTKKGFTLGAFTKERYFTISIPQNPAVGIYKIEGNSLKAFADYYVKNGGLIGFKTGKCEGAVGTLEITAINGKKIKGKFSFTATQIVVPCSAPTTRNITNGVFEATFINE